MKTDFTRTGKRSMMGSVRDGLMSIKRFVAEQTSYAARNDELNAFLGKVQMSRPDATTRVNTAQSSSDEARRSRACQRFANVVEVDHGDECSTKPVVLEIDSHSGTLRIEYVSDYLQRCVAISSVLSVETALLDMAFVFLSSFHLFSCFLTRFFLLFRRVHLAIDTEPFPLLFKFCSVSTALVFTQTLRPLLANCADIKWDEPITPRIWVGTWNTRLLLLIVPCAHNPFHTCVP